MLESPKPNRPKPRHSCRVTCDMKLERKMPQAIAITVGRKMPKDTHLGKHLANRASSV